MSYTIGIDVGGTFTDIVVSAPDRGIVIAKAATTPADQSTGVLEGIGLAAERLGVERVLVVEDSAAGIAAGKAAGFEVIAVKHPSEVPAMLRARLQR